MVDKINNKEKSQNYVELTEKQIFEQIKKELGFVQDKLLEKSEKKITVDEAKSELKKINDWIQKTKLEIKDKEKIWDAFEKLSVNLENSIEKNQLKFEFNEIVNLLEKLTKKDLANLKRWIQQNKRQRTPESLTEVQRWISESSNNLASTIHDASQDKNSVARKIWQRMEKLMS